ncbi:hypothetical protein LTR22_000353 [Elasticomyces elasticus]|nr:hypothetical protein LTR22_000353 [Elasticomyces elasticus]KAK4924989.1 hypothetical protein LTR49_007995 [Elasticomyces elasticus]KAK5763246.1 hypothetical protein LTS12_006630 [Elasticomyces elasticus]
MDAIYVVKPQPTYKLVEPASSNSERCLLLELPPELRVRIYEFVYEDHRHLRAVFFNVDSEGQMKKFSPWRRRQSDKPTSALSRKPFDPTPMLKVCRLITTEATPVLYKIMTVTVHFTIFDEVEGGAILLPAIRDHFFTQVKNVALCVWAYGLENVEATSRLMPIVFGPEPRSKTIKEVQIGFDYGSPGGIEAVDYAYQELMKLSYDQYARVDCWGDPAREVMKEFMRKTGVTPVEVGAVRD